MLNVDETIISQYSTAPTLVQIIHNLNTYIDARHNLDDFYNQVWNVDTAVGWGLDVWGRIVGVGRTLSIAVNKYFGFDEATNVSADPFNQSPYYSGQTTTQNYVLSDDGFRTLIIAKALANICDGCIPVLNQLLLYLFPGRGNCYVVDGNDMTMTYTFEFPLTPVEVAIVTNSGVLPVSTGVAVSVAVI